MAGLFAFARLAKRRNGLRHCCGRFLVSTHIGEPLRDMCLKRGENHAFGSLFAGRFGGDNDHDTGHVR